MKHDWFSATLRFYKVTREQGRVGGEDSVYLVRAAHFDEAMVKFLAIGRKREGSFRNAKGQELRVRFVGLTTMDIIRGEQLESSEILCVPLMDKDPSFTFESPLAPEESRPDQTF